jgi:hypothetical protein
MTPPIIVPESENPRAACRLARCLLIRTVSVIDISSCYRQVVTVGENNRLGQRRWIGQAFERR